MQKKNVNTSNSLKKICVYCGSGPGTDPAYVAAAQEFGALMAEAGIGLVYGGGSVGIMGAIAEAVRKNGGEVTGIIPDFLVRREHADRRNDELIITRDMHERKRLMFEKADAFVALPGGVGTLEELVEQLTWVQLGRHRKPVLVANVLGFWQPFCGLLDHMKRLEFIRGDLDFNLLVADTISDILPMLQNAIAATPADAKKLTGAGADQL